MNSNMERRKLPRPGEVVETFKHYNGFVWCIARVYARPPGDADPYKVVVFVEGFEPEYLHQKINYEGTIYGEVGSGYVHSLKAARRVMHRRLRSYMRYRKRFS